MLEIRSRRPSRSALCRTSSTLECRRLDEPMALGLLAKVLLAFAHSGPAGLALLLERKLTLSDRLLALCQRRVPFGQLAHGGAMDQRRRPAEERGDAAADMIFARVSGNAYEPNIPAPGPALYGIGALRIVTRCRENRPTPDLTEPLAPRERRDLAQGAEAEL